MPEVYAKEAIFLHDEPRRELKLQAIRIGELGITAIPNEVFAITGLKIKAQSPFETTMNIELANGSEGYIPPPEQHALGGYTTWPARTAGLEVQAEPKIVAAVLGSARTGRGQAAARVAIDVTARMPRLSLLRSLWPTGGSMTSRVRSRSIPPATAVTPATRTASPSTCRARMPPASPPTGRSTGRPISREAGSRPSSRACRSPTPSSSGSGTACQNDARPVTGFLFSIGREGAGDTLSLGGTQLVPGDLFYTAADAFNLPSGPYSPENLPREIVPKTWHHLALVRDGKTASTWLDGNLKTRMGLAAKRVRDRRRSAESVLFIGGRSDGTANFEGKIDEVAFYDRALTADEIAGHVRAARAR